MKQTQEILKVASCSQACCACQKIQSRRRERENMYQKRMLVNELEVLKAEELFLILGGVLV
jgi:hypothetical protein